MASGGAPPTSGDPRLLFEYLDDPDLHISNAANGYSMADVSKGRLHWTTTVPGLAAFYSTQTATRLALANGLCLWRCDENVAAARGGFAARLIMPTHVAPADAPTLPAAMRRWKRFTYEAALYRDSLATGVFQVGLVDGNVGVNALQLSTTFTGLVVASDSAVSAGAWQVQRRNDNGDPLITAMVAGGALQLQKIEHVKFQLVTGPVRRLVVSWNGNAVATLEDSDLPKGLQTGSLFGWGPQFCARPSVIGGTFSGVVASRYACELL